ncbi:hypothetical protein FBU31_006073 [Coemansia sp. 'formosensis']|nr:hypothetical protein FBU31_006073 [Coemansia sp. 'formosensis']
MSVKMMHNQNEVVSIKSFKDLYALLLASPRTIVMVAKNEDTYSKMASVIVDVVGDGYTLAKIDMEKYNFPGIQDDWTMLYNSEVLVLIYHRLRWMRDINDEFVHTVCDRIKAETQCDAYTDSSKLPIHKSAITA